MEAKEVWSKCIAEVSSKILIFNSLQLWLLPFLLIEIQTTWKSSLSGESNQEEGSKRRECLVPLYYSVQKQTKLLVFQTKGSLSSIGAKMHAFFTLLMAFAKWNTWFTKCKQIYQPTTMIKLPITVSSVVLCAP